MATGPRRRGTWGGSVRVRVGIRFDVDDAPRLTEEPRGGTWEHDHLEDSIAMYPGICVLDPAALGRKPKRHSRR